MTRVIPAAHLVPLIAAYDREPAYQGLAEALRVVIADGRVPVGARLPSERDLTAALDVSRTTVARAYAELRDAGYLKSRRGSGSVAALPGGRGVVGDRVLPIPEPDLQGIDLTCAAPGPGPNLLAAYQRATAELPRFLTGSGYYPSGVPELREAVASRFARQGLPTDPDQIMITPGAQAGVAALAHTFRQPRGRILVESPNYPNAVAVLKAHGRIFTSHVAADQGDVTDLLAAIRQVKPTTTFLVPDFHNPTGRVISAEDRVRLGQALRAVGSIGIIDESLRDLHLDGGDLPPPMGIVSEDLITVGSMSKAFWGGLRIGWIRVPHRHMDALLAARLTLDLGAPILEQLVAIEVLDDEDALLDHRREQLRESRDAALEALAEHLPSWRVNRPAGGLSLWCELPEPRSTDLYHHAVSNGVHIAPGPSFAPEGGLDRYLRVPFAQSAQVIRQAIPLLADAWRRTLSMPRLARTAEPNLVA